MRTAPKRAGIAVALTLAVAAGPVLARQSVPANLGYGLDALVESRISLQQHPAAPTYGGYATEAAAYFADRAITDAATGRVMVDVTLGGRVDADNVRKAIEASIPSFTVTAVDKAYRRTGIIEGYVSVDDAAALSQIKGVRAVFLALKPDLESLRPAEAAATTQAQASSGASPDVLPGEQLRKLGTAFDQGVVQHGVDRINQYYNSAAPINIDGAGISVGVLSDSFDKVSGTPQAPIGVANYDLPGSATHPLNSQPVVVLEDYPATGTDEGRAMVEIVHKMAPRARLAFATAFGGEVGFANNVRALAALPGYEYPAGTQQGFKADVIVDDVSYAGEPFYGESIVGNAIDDVAAAGVSYFSSAGNNIGINGYDSALRVVPNGTGLTAAAGNTALTGTNIDLTGVPANLYAGGFHNFNPNVGQQDVAQLVNMPSSTTALTEMQWDDPYDQHDLTLVQPPIMSASGNIDGTTVTFVTYDGTSTPALPVFTQGTAYVINVVAPNPVTNTFDAVVTIRDPSNNVILTQDTGTDETVNFYPPVSGQYKITIQAYTGTSGAFDITVNTATGNTAGVTTDLNLLAFDVNGAYISARSLTANNLANNRPVEFAVVRPPSGSQMQFVIARANIPAANLVRPSRVRWSTRGNGAAGIGPAEYFSYNTVTTKGHATAKGCIGTAAYAVFRPSLPESFTSPGPATIVFDKDANRLPAPEIRQVPRVAAADAGNTSFFSGDTNRDPDTVPNFSGTSAAAPHAAAIAALVLQSRGGPGSVTPDQMVTLLQKNAFPHDLDPSSASGTAVASDGGGVVIRIDSDNDTNLLTGENDLNSIQVTYLGPGSLATLVFNPAGTAATGGNVTGGNNGVVDALPFVNYFENSYPGMAFLPATRAFALGTLSGLAPADVTAPLSTAPFTGFSNLAPAPANGTTQFFTMSLAFPTGNFTDSKVLRFTVGRGQAHSAKVDTGTGPTGGAVTREPIADMFGGGVKLPSGQRITDGMTFSGTTTGGATFTGTIKNKIGHGYSNVDGYGFIDAMSAVDRIFATDNE